MQNYKKQFKGKKVTIMGLGLLGRGIGYTKFLAECGADLIVTDLKPSTMLRSPLTKLRTFKNIKFVLGEHRLEDFRNRDMIIKNPGVPMDSIYIAEARKNNIPIEMDASLFAKCAPGVMIVGVTGTRGKSMTTMLVYEILKQNEKFLKHPSTSLRIKKPSVFLGGNIRGVATLPLLKKVKDGDILVAELDSWQLQGFGEDKISPNISVFTTFMRDHMNYYTSTGLSTGKAMKKYFADKANIFKYQKRGDTLVIRKEMKKLIPKNIASKLIVANEKLVAGWKFVVPGSHQRANLACAVAAAQVLGVPMEVIKKTVAKFKGMEGRLQLLKTVKGVKIYNDNNATTPEATIASLEALKSGSRTSKNIILITGGNDKGVDIKNFINAINKYCKVVITIPGTGTDKLALSLASDRVNVQRTEDLKSAVMRAVKQSKKGDTILFSPAFSSFSQYNNEYERNDDFIKKIKKLK
jgi:UDP-N-acetylmuramoylalanine--D-glutamate ligase